MGLPTASQELPHPELCRDPEVTLWPLAPGWSRRGMDTRGHMEPQQRGHVVLPLHTQRMKSKGIAFQSSSHLRKRMPTSEVSIS